VIAFLAITGVRSQGAFDDMSGYSSFSVSQVTHKIQTFAEGISRAENSDSAYNNPGDITPPGWTGPTFGEGIAQFQSANEGWMRLYYELWLIATGQSKVYSLSDTIATMSLKWTTTNQDGWAAAVSQYTGYSIGTTLQEALI
jgi:hypothetical protein